MKDSILKVASHLENGTIDSDKARSLLLNLFGFSGSLQPLTIDTVNKMLKKVSQETWIAVQGDEHGWKEWYAERCKLNLNCNDRAQQEALRLSAVSHCLLRELRQTYLVNVDTSGHPKASITEIMDLWDRVNRELQIVTID